ncbi:MAG: choice-of-anchor Q domain-containing protein [Pirellulales bacterium]
MRRFPISWTTISTQLGFKRKRKQRHQHGERARRSRFEPLEARHMLAVLMVNSTANDSLPNDGYVTLREAISAAWGNTTTDLGHTGSSSEPDTIRFDESLFVNGHATIELASKIDVNSNLTIEGPGADLLTISGEGVTRVFEEFYNYYVTMSGISIVDGFANDEGGPDSRGGGIYNGSGYLVLDGVEFRGNTANTNGGAIYSVGGSLTVLNSTFYGNHAGTGGAIYASSGTLTILNSTFDENGAGSGGAIYTSSGTSGTHSQIVNSTFSNNSGVALYIPGSAYVDVINSTLSANTSNSLPGGIYRSFTSQTVTLHNTIVAGNTGSGGAASDLSASGFSPDSSYNLIGVTTSTAFGDDGNQVIGSAAPGLTPLGNYGGPTKTHAPLPDSPAINAGDDGIAVSAGLLFDQRGAGYQRALGSAVDIGATEAWLRELADGSVEIYGTDASDTITISSAEVTHSAFGEMEIDLTAATEVRVYGEGGDDELAIDPTFTRPAKLFGGTGNDILSGGAAVDHLFGQSGDDTYVADAAGLYLDDIFSDSDEVVRLVNQHGNSNHLPHLQPVANRTVDAGKEIAFDLIANDIDEPSSSLTYALVGDTHGASLSSSGEFTWTPAFDVAESTDFEFTAVVSDNGSPQLQHRQTFCIRVLAQIPEGFAVVYDIFEDVEAQVTPIEGAVLYVLERREAGDGAWEVVATSEYHQFIDDETAVQGVAYEYRIKAVNSEEESTPYSPVFSLTLRDPDNYAFVSSFPTQIGSTIRGNFQVASEVQEADLEVAIIRMSSSEDGWQEISRAPLSSYEFVSGNVYRFYDTTGVPTSKTWYAAQVINEGTRTAPVFDYYFPTPAAGAFVDGYITANDYLIRQRDQDEEAIGYIVPLRNTYYEDNFDENGNRVPDNQPDYIEGHRYPFVDFGMEALLNVNFAGGKGSIEFVLPENIKLWGYNPSTFEAEEVESGVQYDIDNTSIPFYVQQFDLWSTSRAELYVEGIEASTSLADVEIEIRFRPDSNPTQVEEDVLALTVVDISPQLPGDLLATDGELHVSVPLAGDGVSAFDGMPVSVRLHRVFALDENLVEKRETYVEQGSVATVFDFEPKFLHESQRYFTIEAEFEGYRFYGFDGVVSTVSILRGEPHSAELTPSKLSYTADGTDETTLTVTIRDKFGNLVEDGTPVSWSLDFGDGYFADGGTAASSETTDGQAVITLRAPETPGIQRVHVTAGAARSIIDIVSEAADFQISGIADLDIATGESGTVTISAANVADGTPVFWTLSNGEIVGANGERVFETTVQNDTASINVQAIGPWARVGSAVITATISGRIHHHVIDFDRSSGFSVELERFVLSGDKMANGVKTLVFENANPMYQGEPVWGFDPPPQNWPAPRDVNYFAETQVTIRGTANETYYILADSPFTTFAEFEGLGANNEIQLNGNGIGTFTIRSKGMLAANEFLAVEFTVREGDPFTGPDETTKIMFTDHGWWASTWDGIKSFTGLTDPQTGTGIAANIAGGVVIVGDVGSIVKNLWRMSGLSANDPSYLELSLSSLGLATEVAVGVGEIADVPISSVRAIVAALGKTPFTDTLVMLLKRGLTNAQDLTKFGLYLTKILRNNNTFQIAQQVFTSPQAMEAGVKAVDDLGDGFVTGLTNFFRDNVKQIDDGVFASTFGPALGQRLTEVFSSLDAASLTYFKSLDELQLARAVTDAGLIMARGIDSADLKKILAIDQLYGPGLTQADMLADLAVIATENAEGFEKLVKSIASVSPNTPLEFVYGNVYEARALARLLREGKVFDVEIIRKLVKANPDGTGRILTDIDFIGIDQTTGVRAYFQTKISPEAFESLTKVQEWVAKAIEDARRDGILDPVIRYVTPDPSSVPQDIRDFLLGIDQNIFIAAPL